MSPVVRLRRYLEQCRHGSKDTQVLATQNEPLAKREVRHPDSRTHVFENEYGRITETMNPTVFDELLTWIQAHG